MEHFFQELDGWFDDPIDRELYSEMVEKYPSGSHFVEIGSYKGKSSSLMAVEIINSNKDIRFDCVDTWLGSPERQVLAEVRNDMLFDIFTENTKPVVHKINAVRAASAEACSLYEDKSLDFVFIDADHSYEAVKEDLEAWFPKIKDGGTIAGHDYGNPSNGVKPAVDEFFLEKNLEIVTLRHLWKVYV